MSTIRQKVSRAVTSIAGGAGRQSPEEIETEIVQEQEEQLKSVEGVIKMTSESMDSRSTVTLEFEVGSGQIIPGLDKELVGMAIGDSKQVTVSPEEGYGPTNPEAFSEVPITDLPEDARKAGTALMARDGDGNTQQLTVHKIDGETATLDFNHDNPGIIGGGDGPGTIWFDELEALGDHLLGYDAIADGDDFGIETCQRNRTGRHLRIDLGVHHHGLHRDRRPRQGAAGSELFPCAPRGGRPRGPFRRSRSSARSSRSPCA